MDLPLKQASADADDGFSALPTDVPIFNDPTWNSVSEQLAILSSSVDLPNSLLDDFVSAYFGMQRFFKTLNTKMTLVITSRTTMKVV